MKTTDSRHHALRHRIAQAQAQPRCRYGLELKREIVAYTTARHAQGTTLRTIAAELGLSYGVLCTWMRHARRRRDAGKLPFEAARPAAVPPLRTKPLSSAAAPTRAPSAVAPPPQGLWLVLRVDHVHVTAETRATLLRWLSALPPEAAPAAVSL